MESELGGAENAEPDDEAVEGGELGEVSAIVGVITVATAPHIDKSVKAGLA